MTGVNQEPNKRSAEALDQLERGREAYDRRAWDDAYRCLSLADEAAPLGVDDLERLAMSAYLTGRDEAYLRALDRAHHVSFDNGDHVRAARCAFWVGLRLALRGEGATASGWLTRARRLLERAGRECVEEGYLLLPAAEQQLGAGDTAGAFAAAARAAEIGDRFEEPDLSACARHMQGRALIKQGRVDDGFALLDEAMVAVAGGELSPIMTGLIYCSVIDACQQIQAMERAREWTSALAGWCSGQPQLIAFTGICLVHRAEVMQLAGAWPDALAEARQACAAWSERTDQRAPGAAFYQQAEVHRLRGDFADAEEAYREASRRGHEPQPGLALLWLAQKRSATAATAIRRAVSTTADRAKRSKLLPALVEIMIAAGDLDAARSACRDLQETAEHVQTGALRAMAAQAQGAVDLAEGDPRAALGHLRSAFELWLHVEAPYLAARTRELIGVACRALGDDESAELELNAARDAYERLGAAPDLGRLDGQRPNDSAAGLTRRELQVLRLVAAGRTNKAIAAELFISPKTVDRHLSNILNRLGVSSRTAAAAWAYQHKLVRS